MEVSVTDIRSAIAYSACEQHESPPDVVYVCLGPLAGTTTMLGYAALGA